MLIDMTPSNRSEVCQCFSDRIEVLAKTREAINVHRERAGGSAKRMMLTFPARCVSGADNHLGQRCEGLVAPV
jgi:hypothetical protein